jgi:large subunit ribosomal protein L10
MTRLRLCLQCIATRSARPLERRWRASTSPLARSSRPQSASSSSRSYATAAVAASSRSVAALRLPDDYVPPTKPPSVKPSDIRKSQLLRTYTALLRSSPLLLLFQHNNLTGGEFTALRRELYAALDQIAQASATDDVEAKERLTAVARHTKLQVVRKGIFDVALRIVEFYNPANAAQSGTQNAGKASKKDYIHDLSTAATTAARAAKEATSLNPSATESTYAQLAPLLVGPLAVLTFPSVSPAHLSAALRILSPSPPTFPPPTRRKAPGYYDPTAQSALQKVFLVGGRIEGKVFDVGGVQWVGGIEGGLEGLRAQLVHLLQSAGLGLTSALEGAGKSLWMTVEGRRAGLEEEEKAAKGTEATGEGGNETKS